MRFVFKTLLICFITVLISCQNEVVEKSVSSPNSELNVEFNINESGQPQYTVSFNGKIVVKPSLLGFDVKDQKALDKDFTIVKTVYKIFQ